MTAAEQITAVVTEHGEGPVWHPAWNGLCFVDMLAGDVLRLDDSGAVGRWSVGPVAAVVRPDRHDGFIIATEHELVRAAAFGEAPTIVADVFDDPMVRLNEGGCDPAGNFLVGTMAYDESPGRGSMFRLDTAGRVERLFGDLTVSNGLAWTADGTRAYYADSPTGRVDVFDWDVEAGLQDRRPFVSIPVGHPDGLTVDTDDGIWVALWGGRGVYHYSSDGAQDFRVEVPALNVTACAFGGERLDELFITTSRHGDPDESSTTAGAIFRIQPGVGGRPTRPYGG